MAWCVIAVRARAWAQRGRDVPGWTRSRTSTRVSCRRSALPSAAISVAPCGEFRREPAISGLHRARAPAAACSCAGTFLFAWTSRTSQAPLQTHRVLTRFAVSRLPAPLNRANWESAVRARAHFSYGGGALCAAAAAGAGMAAGRHDGLPGAVLCGTPPAAAEFRSQAPSIALSTRPRPGEALPAVRGRWQRRR